MQQIIDSLWERRAARASAPARSLGSARSHGPLATELGRAIGRRVFLPEYRLAPERGMPC